jgi:transcriptional regulator with XRE-family HTH domain
LQFTHIDQDALYERIATNIAYYRKLTGLTQTQLAERINYSDKSVSKWERAASAPDIYVLTSIAELFGITVNDLISENAPSPPPDPSLREKRRVVVCSQFVALVWLLATTVFTVLVLAFPDVPYPWSVFIFAAPASAAVCVVFCAMWWGHNARLLSVSALAWTTAACVYLLMLQHKFAFLLFTVCAATQIIVLLWYFHNRLKEKR